MDLNRVSQLIAELNRIKGGKKGPGKGGGKKGDGKGKKGDSKGKSQHGLSGQQNFGYQGGKGKGKGESKGKKGQGKGGGKKGDGKGKSTLVTVVRLVILSTCAIRTPTASR